MNKDDKILNTVSENIRKAQSLLKQSDVPDADTVHDVRVFMKKARAALKLIARRFDETEYRNLQKDLKEPGQRLRSLREASVYRRRLKSLLRKYPELKSNLAGNIIICSLLAKKDYVSSLSEGTDSLCIELIDLLDKADSVLKEQPKEKLSGEILLKELECSFKTAMNHYLVSRNRPRTRNLHEYRKKVKDLLYQLAFFRHSGIGHIKRLGKKLNKITTDLGKFNDMAQLIKKLSYKYPGTEDNPAMDQLVAIIRAKQDKCLARVLPASFKIYFRFGFKFSDES
jgi:CHAD domain-containing protein